MQPSVFDRLRHLLGGSLVSDTSIALHLGELQAGVPHEHLSPLTEHASAWGRYPSLPAAPELENAYRCWLHRRFPGVDATRHDWQMEQTPGSKQALATTIALAVQRARERGVTQPVVLLPNPFYPTCPVAARAAGASVRYYDVIGADTASVEDLLRSEEGRACALVLCTPSNPGGEVLAPATLQRLTSLAGQHDVDLIIDECYVDLGLDTEVAGALETMAALVDVPCRWVVLHTLSKRSALPGLRSGWLVGSAAAVQAYARFNRSCGVSTALPVALVAARLWADDERVTTLRSVIRRNWAMAERLLGHLPGFQRPEAGFFLWMPVQDDELAAVDLWQRHQLTVMPGRFLSAPRDDGVNPGGGHIRISLVHSESLMHEALSRLAAALPTLVPTAHRT